MGKKKSSSHDVPHLYEHHERTLRQRARRQRALFIPRFLRDAASDKQLAGTTQDHAYELAVRWADLETAGHLPKHKETSIDTQFLDQIFGEGLGYKVKTTSPTSWQLEHKFTVPGGLTADGAIGDFPSAKQPAAVIELKDASTDLDRDRSNGRTAVQQCWDYLNALPECPWGIVSNFSTIRLYHREKGSLAYEEFTLQELRKRATFNEFYCLLERGGLLKSKLSQTPRALALLQQTSKQQREVGDALYKSYQWQRLRLIEHLKLDHKKSLDEAIRVAQKLLDRIIFIAFCEDRELLPDNSLAMAHGSLPPFQRVTNPRWRNFLSLFAAVDKGGNGGRPISAFNGGLFAPDPSIDTLELDDEPWTTGFKGFGDYDFSEEVNVEVLGHLFERSVTELEKLRVGGLFALKASVEALNGTNGNGSTSIAKKSVTVPAAVPEDSPLSKMPKSAQRKRFGIYYTPPAFTGLLVERTVDVIVKERFAAVAAKLGVNPDSRKAQDQRQLRAYWLGCLDALKSITICDPACGSGAFLIRAYDAMDAHYKAVTHGLGGSGVSAAELTPIEDSIPDLILNHNIFGVDLSLEATEITQLALWIRSARIGKTLADLSKHIVCGNSLVDDPGADPKALNWMKAFPSIFGRGKPGGFTCIIGNPPWERVKLQEREFFSLTDPATAQSVSAADRRKRIADMPKKNPGLHASYLEALAKAQKVLAYARESNRFPLTGKGDVNTYMLFAELAQSIVAPDGLAGLLVPSGIATDETTKDFFTGLMDRKGLVSLFDFENRNKVFEDVDGRFKFSAIVFGGQDRTTEKTDFVFFAHGIEETSPLNRQRHIPLTAQDLKLLNPNTRTCPIFRTRRDAELTKAIYKRVPILIDQNRKQGGNPWGIKFFTMFHQTNDAEHFQPRAHWDQAKYKLSGSVFGSGKKRALPLYEAKMVQAFDHRAASVIVEGENWVRQGQKEETTPVEHANPEFAVLPRWWVDESQVVKVTDSKRDWLLAYKDVTSATNERTMIAAILPWAAVVNSAPIIFPGADVKPRRECCLLANLNAFAYDFVARQKVGSVHLNFFIVEQLPTLPPDAYTARCSWSKREILEDWISDRVLKLSCTAEDMIPLATACSFKGSRGDGVHVWKEQERALLRAELDAAFFHLYQVEREDVEHMLSTFTSTGFNDPDAQGHGEPKWDPQGAGAMILDAYDAMGMH